MAEETAKAGRENVLVWLSKFIAALVLLATVLGAAIAILTELFTQRIVVEPVNTAPIAKHQNYVPNNLNLRIVEKIEQIRRETGSRLSNAQQAVTRVDDVSFKAEGFEFSVIKLLAPIKAAFGLSDKRVTSELTCYRPDCEFEAEIEEERFSDKGVATAATPPPARDMLRLRFVAVIEDSAGTKTHEARLSLGKWNFTREIDVEALNAAESIMAWADPVTAASFFYLRSTQYSGRYNITKYRKRAVSAARLAHERGRADFCWMNNLLATIAVDEMDLNGANYRIDSVSEAIRSSDRNCDAQLHLTRGRIKLREVDWTAYREGVDDTIEHLRQIAYEEFKLACSDKSASPDTRATALVQAARVVEKLHPKDIELAIAELARPFDKKASGSLIAHRGDLAMKLLVETGRLESRHGRVDPALTSLWKAVQAFPGAVEPYVEIARNLRIRAQAPNISPAERDRNLLEADRVLHQALNDSADERAVEIRVLLADLHVDRNDIRAALRELANVTYELDRSHHRPSSMEYEKRAYSHWLYLLRRIAPRSPEACASKIYGVTPLKNDSSLLFPSRARAASCEGDMGEQWPSVRSYEQKCAAKERFNLESCIEKVDEDSD